MDHDPSPLRGDEDDRLEEVPGTIRPDDQPTIWIIAEVVDHEVMLDRMENVRIGDAMTAG